MVRAIVEKEEGEISDNSDTDVADTRNSGNSNAQSIHDLRLAVLRSVVKRKMASKLPDQKQPLPIPIVKDVAIALPVSAAADGNSSDMEIDEWVPAIIHIPVNRLPDNRLPVNHLPMNHLPTSAAATIVATEKGMIAPLNLPSIPTIQLIPIVPPIPIQIPIPIPIPIAPVQVPAVQGFVF